MKHAPRLRVVADYDCHPTWSRRKDGGLDNIEPTLLGLPQLLAAALTSWAQSFDRTLDRSDPTASGFATDVEHQLFVQWGLALSAWMATEMREPVEYFDDRERRARIVDPS